MNIRLNCQEEARNYAVVTPLARVGFSGHLCYKRKRKEPKQQACFRLKSTLAEALPLTGTVSLPSGNEMKMTFAEGGLLSDVHFIAHG